MPGLSSVRMTTLAGSRDQPQTGDLIGGEISLTIRGVCNVLLQVLDI
jgi:hypothetical protein